MALRNPKLFGLNVFSALADVVDKEQSLNSLNLSSRDLDIIRGSQNAGASSGDWISFSRLIDPLYRTLDRYKTDSEAYGTLLDARAGTERTLFGNLSINGILSGNAVRYRYLDGTGSGATVKIADISTSRVSAWSSSASPIISTSPISYGAQVSIKSGGGLQFGTQSGTTGPRLQTSLTPQAKEFASEFPTSKITCTIGGQSVVLYAMKGIPLIFTGFFRNLDTSIGLTSLISNTSASWKIVETANPNNFTNFANRGNTTSSINFRSSVSRERYIQFYYNPDNISKITLTSANITELPAVKLQNATELNFSNNQLRNFPDFTFISPTLQSLNLINNPLSQSEIETERKLNSAVLNKIPQSLRDLYLAKTFYGSISQNIIANRFTNLKILNLNRTDDTGPYFHPDTDDANCQLPNVPNSCQTYLVSRNDFRSFGTSVGAAKSVPDLTNLISLDVSLNWNLSVVGPFSIADGNIVIQSIRSNHTNLPLPTGLSGKNSFTTLYHYWCRSAGPLVNGGTYLYDNCNSLSTLHLYGSNVTGRLPKFTNAALSYLDLRVTNLTGGGPDGDETNVIPERTFEKCTNLVYMLIQSRLLLTAPIHPNAFSYTPNLYYLWYISYGKTTGNIPSLTLNSNLQFLVLHNNKFDGTMPSFTSNPNIRYVDITYNALSGAIPPLKNLQNLNRLLVYNNQFTSLSTFANLSNFQYFYAQSNKLSGEIPSFAGCPNLLYLILFNNLLTDYKTGALATNYRLNYLDLSRNLLTGQAVNQIIADLLLNYNTVNRGGVTVNLRGGNALPSGVALDSIDILRSKGWSIVFN
jgi:Leucine-rich repeat (LRR) protein